MIERGDRTPEPLPWLTGQTAGNGASASRLDVGPESRFACGVDEAVEECDVARRAHCPEQGFAFTVALRVELIEKLTCLRPVGIGQAGQCGPQEVAQDVSVANPAQRGAEPTELLPKVVAPCHVEDRAKSTQIRSESPGRDACPVHALGVFADPDHGIVNEETMNGVIDAQTDQLRRRRVAADFVVGSGLNTVRTQSERSRHLGE